MSICVMVAESRVWQDERRVGYEFEHLILIVNFNFRVLLQQKCKSGHTQVFRYGGPFRLRAVSLIEPMVLSLERKEHRRAPISPML